MGYMLLIDEIRKNGHRLTGSTQRFFLDGGCERGPRLLYWILSYIPKHVMEKIEPFFNIVIDSLNVIVIYIFCMSVLRHYDINNPGLWALVICFLFMFCPLFWSNIGRPCFFSGRNIGFLFGNIFFLSLIYYFVVSKTFLPLLVSFIGFLVAAFTGLFSLQAIVFISFFWGIATLNIEMIITLVLFFVVIFIPMLKTGMISHHIGHLSGFAKFMDNYPTTPKITFGDWKKLLRAIFCFDIKGIIQSIHRIPLVRGIMFCPGILIFVASLFISTGTVRNYWILLSLSIAIIVVFFIVTLNKFRFLGEAERYLDYFVVPSFLSMIILFRGAYFPIIITFVIYLFVSIINLCIFIRQHLKMNLKLNGIRDAIMFFKNIETSSVFAVSARWTIPIAYETSHLILFFLASVPKSGQKKQDYINVYNNGRQINDSNIAMFFEMMSRYNIEYFLIEKSRLKIEIMEKFWDKVFENKDFLVFKHEKTEFGVQL